MGRFSVWIWLVILLAVGLATYAVGLNIAHYGDDLGFIYDPPPEDSLHYFTHMTHYNPLAYRPTEATTLVIIQKRFGLQTWPVHLLMILLHVLLCWLVFLAARELGFSGVQAGVASVYMLLAQLNPIAVLSNDTLAQIYSTLFGFISVCAFYRAYVVHDPPPIATPWAYALSVVAFAAAIFSKETSFSLVPVIGFLMLSPYFRRDRRPLRWDRLAVAILPYAMVLGVYFAARSQVGAHMPEGGSENAYSIRVGSNLFLNSGQLTVALLLPVSSVTVVTSLRSRDVPALALEGGAFAVFLLLLVLGLSRCEQRRTLVGLAMCAYFSLFPAVLANHVSELYAYNALPYFSILVGAGLGRLLMAARSGSLANGLVVTALVALSASLIAAVVSKGRMMEANGERAARLLPQVVPHIKDVPPGGYVVFMNSDSVERPYSVYLLPEFHVLAEYSRHRLRQLAGRADFGVRVLTRSEADGGAVPPKSLVLTLEGDEIVVYKRPGG